MTPPKGDARFPAPGTPSTDAERDFQFVVECSQRYLRRIRLATTLGILASTAVLAIVLEFGLGIYSLGDEVSVFALFTIAVGAALGFRYYIPKTVRYKVAFYRQLLPIARGYAYGAQVRIASVLTNGLVIRDFDIPRGSQSGSGLGFEILLSADGSPLPPEAGSIRWDLDVLPPRTSLGDLRQKAAAGREEAYALANRLGTRRVHTYVREVRDGTDGDGTRPRWRASIWFWHDRWYTKADWVVQSEADLLTLLTDITAKRIARPLEPS